MAAAPNPYAAFSVQVDPPTSFSPPTDLIDNDEDVMMSDLSPSQPMPINNTPFHLFPPSRFSPRDFVLDLPPPLLPTLSDPIPTPVAHSRLAAHTQPILDLSDIDDHFADTRYFRHLAYFQSQLGNKTTFTDIDGRTGVRVQAGQIKVDNAYGLYEVETWPGAKEQVVWTQWVVAAARAESEGKIMPVVPEQARDMFRLAVLDAVRGRPSEHWMMATGSRLHRAICRAYKVSAMARDSVRNYGGSGLLQHEVIEWVDVVLRQPGRRFDAMAFGSMGFQVLEVVTEMTMVNKAMGRRVRKRLSELPVWLVGGGRLPTGEDGSLLPICQIRTRTKVVIDHAASAAGLDQQSQPEQDVPASSVLSGPSAATGEQAQILPQPVRQPTMERLLSPLHTSRSAPQTMEQLGIEATHQLPQLTGEGAGDAGATNNPGLGVDRATTLSMSRKSNANTPIVPSSSLHAIQASGAAALSSAGLEPLAPTKPSIVSILPPMSTAKAGNFNVKWTDSATRQQDPPAPVADMVKQRSAEQNVSTEQSPSLSASGQRGAPPSPAPPSANPSSASAPASRIAGSTLPHAGQADRQSVQYQPMKPSGLRLSITASSTDDSPAIAQATPTAAMGPSVTRQSMPTFPDQHHQRLERSIGRPNSVPGANPDGVRGQQHTTPQPVPYSQAWLQSAKKAQKQAQSSILPQQGRSATHPQRQPTVGVKTGQPPRHLSDTPVSAHHTGLTLDSRLLTPGTGTQSAASASTNLHSGRPNENSPAAVRRVPRHLYRPIPNFAPGEARDGLRAALHNNFDHNTAIQELMQMKEHIVHGVWSYPNHTNRSDAESSAYAEKVINGQFRGFLEQWRLHVLGIDYNALDRVEPRAIGRLLAYMKATLRQCSPLIHPATAESRQNHEVCCEFEARRWSLEVLKSWTDMFSRERIQLIQKPGHLRYKQLGDGLAIDLMTRKEVNQ